MSATKPTAGGPQSPGGSEGTRFPPSPGGGHATPRTVERRSFLWKAGATLSATVASAAALASGAPSRAGLASGDSSRVAHVTDSAVELERLASQLRLREDTDAIRQLHQSFMTALNERRYEDVIALFTGDAAVHLNGAVFSGRERGVRHLYVERFGGHFAAQESQPVHACVTGAAQECTIDVASDGQSATASFPCVTRVETALTCSSSLVEMARQQGQGIAQEWEHGLYENRYVKEGTIWRIAQLRYRSNGRASAPREA
jgi:hypothetical protein